MGETIILPEQRGSLPAYEKLVDLPDKRVLVIGTNHGKLSITPHPFPGRLHTEQEILDIFGQTVPDAFIIDSMSDIDDEERNKFLGNREILLGTRKTEVSTKNDTDLSFWEWGVKQGMDGKTLILADPIAMIPRLGHFITLESSYNFPTREDKESAEIISNAAAISLLGLAIACGVAVKPKLTRRAFLAGSGAAIATSLLTKEQVKEWLKTSLPRKVLKPDKADVVKMEAFFSEPRQLTEEDYTRPDFQTFAIFQESRQYVNAFRNAMIAEVLSLPSSELHLQTDENHRKADIAVVMGSGHLISRKHSISYFLENEKARQDILEELFKGVFKGIELINWVFRDSYGKDVPVDELKTAFRNYPRSYKIDRNGDATVLPIRVSGIEAIIDRVA